MSALDARRTLSWSAAHSVVHTETSRVKLSKSDEKKMVIQCAFVLADSISRKKEKDDQIADKIMSLTIDVSARYTLSADTP